MPVLVVHTLSSNNLDKCRPQKYNISNTFNVNFSVATLKSKKKHINFNNTFN